MKLIPLLLFLPTFCFSQSRIVISGNVFNARTHDPLPYATIGVLSKPEETISSSTGGFRLNLPTSYIDDTLRITYLGYKPILKKISELQANMRIFMEEDYTLLEEVIISHAEFDIKKIERKLRNIKGNLYGMSTEVTNSEYNLFLVSLEEYQKFELKDRCNYDLSQYDDASKAFFKNYVKKFKAKDQVPDSIEKTLRVGPQQWDDFPAINVSFEGAKEYCKWLTDQYNSYPKKKKFKKVLFRLPTLQEWQIGALGYKDFQSWTLSENSVEVTIGPDSLDMLPKRGVNKTIPASDILYPWHGSYYYRKSPQNHKNCFLGNFKIDSTQYQCPVPKNAFDGWSMMALTASYFPNDMGLCDVVGNVAEMVDEKGKACGGSWAEEPSNSTIHSVKSYTRPDATIGFRVFMEVIEP